MADRGETGDGADGAGPTGDESIGDSDESTDDRDDARSTGTLGRVKTSVREAVGVVVDAVLDAI
ncbi:hypothetical protein [Halorubrum depositum]|uniref:hypothetical protein n=1 Tax=Halorubrum depositum TaxID=2583992 RepID=UPI0011A9EEE6|nr:hypothetical protein [Halorubrum depositum]